MKHIALFALVMLIGYGLQASKPATAQEIPPTEDQMAQLIAMVQANAEAIQAMRERAEAHIPETTHKVVNIPPEPQIIEATSPKSFAVNHEARVAGQVYVTEVPKLQQVITREMPVPDGYQVVRVQHAPKYQVSEYAQPDTFQIQPIVQPVITQPITITAAQEGAIITITEDDIKYVEK